MQLLVQLKGDYLRTRIPLKTLRLAGGEQEVAGEREELGWAAEEAAVVAAEAPKVGVEEVVGGQEEVGLPLKTELGQGAGEEEEEVQVVLGQHLVSEWKQTEDIKDLENKGLALIETVVLLLSVRDIKTGKILGKKTLNFSRREACLLNVLKIWHIMLWEIRQFHRHLHETPPVRFCAATKNNFIPGNRQRVKSGMSITAGGTIGCAHMVLNSISLY